LFSFIFYKKLGIGGGDRTYGEREEYRGSGRGEYSGKVRTGGGGSTGGKYVRTGGGGISIHGS